MTLFELKRAVGRALTANDIDAVAALAAKDRRVINLLMSFSYDKESELSWRAILAVGRAAAILLVEDYDFLRDTTRRLIWSVTEESGNVAWSSVEMLSEIVACDIDRFGDLVPLIVSMYEEPLFREGVAYGLARFADVSPSLPSAYAGVIMEALADRNPRVRYYALQCVKKGNLHLPAELAGRIRSEDGVAHVYTGESFEDVRLDSLLPPV